MGVSLVIVKTDVKELDGKKVCPLQLQYKYKGTYKRFPTKEYIEPKYWKSGVVSNRCPNYTQIIKRVTSVRTKLEGIITQLIENGDIPTPIMVKINYEKKVETQTKKQPKSKSFWSSYDLFLKDKERYHRGYTKTLISLQNTLLKFEIDTKHKLSYDYILYGRFETEFKTHCLDIELPTKEGSKEKKVGLSNNYVNKLFSNLKIFLSWSKEQRFITETKRFKPLKMVRNDVLVYLNTEEVKKMYDYKEYDYPKTYTNCEVVKDIDKDGKTLYWNNLELIKDIFTFQCSVGCRWGDIHKMNVGMFKIEKGFFVWTMEKTKDNVIVPENPISLGIFRKYSKNKSLSQKLFPKYSQPNFNLHLKDIGKELGFKRLVKREIMVGGELRKGSEKDVFTYELLSSHSGRRSFIKNLIDMGTMDNWSIMKLSGHKTLSSFQKYVSVNKDDIKKGQDLYSKEFDVDKDREIKEFIRKYPMEVVLPYYLKMKKS